jgi:hypothetical protein
VRNPGAGGAKSREPDAAIPAKCKKKQTFDIRYIRNVPNHSTREHPMVEIDDNPKNMATCRRYCGTCPTFKKHSLNNYPPHALFCGRGKSAVAGTIVRKDCNCFGCDIFKTNQMNFGFYCIQSGMKK